MTLSDLEKIIARIAPIDQAWIRKAERRQSELTKPPKSLGRLEEIACRMVAIQETLSPHVDHKRIVVFAGDHGVTQEGVSPYPSEVTAQMVANFLNGGAAINAVAATAGAELSIVDAGVASPIPHPNSANPGIRFVQRPICKGTRNFARERALTASETLEAIHLGCETAFEAKQEGVNLIGLGEMGIGNTTSASAIAAALTGSTAVEVTGRGTGVDDEGLLHKRKVVEQALGLHSPDANDPLEILECVGGLEIAGLAGLCLGAAAERIAIVCDGFIATASAALAVRLCPPVADYIFTGHLSTEPGQNPLLAVIGQRPLLNLEMRLGEGTGAALAMSIIDAAVATFVKMATFESANVTDRQETAAKASR